MPVVGRYLRGPVGLATREDTEMLSTVVTDRKKPTTTKRETTRTFSDRRVKNI